MTRHTIICHDPGEYSLAVSSPVNFRESVSIPTFEQSQISFYRDLWQELHTQTKTKEQFEAWVKKVPNFGCGCANWLADYIAKTPPPNSDLAEYGFELHNAVNTKLGKPLFSWLEFAIKCRIDLIPNQPKLSGLVAVTSLAPHRLERQSVCLNSWKQFGLDIVSVNSEAEIESMASSYPQVSRWVSAEFEKTPKINSLIDVARESPILLINSDIEIFGNQSRLLELVASRKNSIGIRHNYEGHPNEATRELWGLDAFMIYPEQVEKLSRVDFTIGKPMWDYWLATELEAMGDCEWIGEPYFYHRAHPVAWTQEECTAAHEAYAKRFEAMDWAAWRRSKPFS